MLNHWQTTPWSKQRMHQFLNPPRIKTHLKVFWLFFYTYAG